MTSFTYRNNPLFRQWLFSQADGYLFTQVFDNGDERESLVKFNPSKMWELYNNQMIDISFADDLDITYELDNNL